MSKYKLILFDLWDTLIKIPNLDILVSETNKALGDDRYSKMKDHFIKWHTSNKTEKTFIEDLNKEISIKKQELPIIKKFITPKYEKFSETDEILKILKNNGLKLVLITNSPPTSKEAFKKLDLPKFFDRTIFSCDVGVLKPDKLIFTYAIKDLDVKPTEVLMVGNSLDEDINGAISAGLDAILIDREGLIEYENKITNLKELVDIVKK